MRVAVVSDIHGNLHALRAVLSAIADDRPDELWCLGDVVGYGPNPNECCALVAERADLCLAGNHDLGVLGTIPLTDFSGDAAAAARWTREVLDPESRAFLAHLESTAARPGIGLFHGSPLDPVWDYVLSEEAAARSFRVSSAPLVLVGHSHVALALTYAAGAVGGGLAPGGTEVPLGGRILLNPGSVGQPRDGDSRAAYLLIDEDARRATFRRVPYPIEETQAEIRARGLPEPLATRLATGV
jgi:diadenosine tetraphosphatase ApaH/serine/threonine PP2A family protein phosphatase